MIYKTSDGVELSFQTYGNPSDTPLVLIHGLGADAGMWAPQIAAYPQHGFYLIVPEVRGHGSTSPVETFRIPDCARDISELLQHLDVPPAAVAGVSMGGAIAQQFACDYPDQVDKLVLVDTFSEVSSVVEKLAGWGQYLTMKIAPGVLKKSLTFVYEGETLRYFQAALERSDIRQLLGARKALNRFDITDRLTTLQIPTRVLVGDGFDKLALGMAEKTTEALPDATMKVIEGGCDPSNLTHPAAFDREVLGFLNPQR